MRITIVGAGKVGSALAIELHKSGHKINVIVDSSKPRAQKISKLCKCDKVSDYLSQEIVSTSDIVIISIKDDDLIKYINNLISIDFKNKILVHTSGVLTSDIFYSLKVKKRDVASFHPAQTFSRVSIRNNNFLKGIFFGIEGGSEAIRILKKITKGLQSRTIVLSKNKKSLYHLGCVVSSNFLVANFYVLKLIAGELGISEKNFSEILYPLFSTTVKNLHLFGVNGSLTGPVSRGDIKTIETHLSLLHSKFPKYVEYYKTVSLILSEVSAKQNNKINYKRISKIINNG